MLFRNILSIYPLVVSRLPIADDTVASGLGINQDIEYSLQKGCVAFLPGKFQPMIKLYSETFEMQHSVITYNKYEKAKNTPESLKFMVRLLSYSLYKICVCG